MTVNCSDVVEFSDQASAVQRGRIEDLTGEYEDLEREWKELNQTDVKLFSSSFFLP